MSEEAEKRLHSVMDKLFHAPKPKPNSPSSCDAQSSKGKKRPNPMSASAIELKLRKDIQKSTTPVEAPLCRPWVREDLMKRLATLKSMKWFAKPLLTISSNNQEIKPWSLIQSGSTDTFAHGLQQQVDDPIASVPKIFVSSSAKRKRTAHGLT